MNGPNNKIGWTDYELGWLSGLIDGEGSISLLKEKRVHQRAGFQYKPRLNVGNKDFKLLKKAQDLIGGAIIGPSKKGVYNLDVSANNMRRILPILKLISKEKQRLLILEALALLQSRHRGKSHPMTDTEIVRFEEIVFEIRNLNGTKWNK